MPQIVKRSVPTEFQGWGNNSSAKNYKKHEQKLAGFHFPSATPEQDAIEAAEAAKQTHNASFDPTHKHHHSPFQSTGTFSAFSETPRYKKIMREEAAKTQQANDKNRPKSRGRHGTQLPSVLAFGSKFPAGRGLVRAESTEPEAMAQSLMMARTGGGLKGLEINTQANDKYLEGPRSHRASTSHGARKDGSPRSPGGLGSPLSKKGKARSPGHKRLHSLNQQGSPAARHRNPFARSEPVKASAGSPKHGGGGGGGDSKGASVSRHTRGTAETLHLETSLSHHNKRGGRSQPMLNMPHRVYPPPFMNAPSRLDFQAEEDGKDKMGTTQGISSPRKGNGHGHAAPSKQAMDVASKKKIKDFKHRAMACRRAGRRRAEANAFYCMGVVYDNLKQFKRAIECYHTFHRILAFAEDKFAEALAHNSIGVSYQNLGPDHFEDAIYHHSRHCEVADVPGKFIAHTNLGLVYNQKGLAEQAAQQHQQALKCAVMMSSTAGQSIAIGNLGLTGMAQKDFVTAHACMERHLELSESLADTRGQQYSLNKLGEVAQEAGEFEEASHYFERALRFAQDTGDRVNVNAAKVNLGVALGNSQFEEHMKQLASKLGGGATPMLK